MKVFDRALQEFPRHFSGYGPDLKYKHYSPVPPYRIDRFWWNSPVNIGCVNVREIWQILSLNGQANLSPDSGYPEKTMILRRFLAIVPRLMLK